MKRAIIAALALVLLIGLQPQSARAQNNTNPWDAFWAWFSHGQDPRLTGVGVGAWHRRRRRVLLADQETRQSRRPRMSASAPPTG